SLPSCSGLQKPGAAPCGCHTPMKRRAGAAAVSRAGVRAGTIDSSSGSASVTPAPRRKVRRGMCLFVRYIVMLLAGSAADPAPVTPPRGAGGRLRGFPPHLKPRASDDADHDGQKPVVLLRSAARDRANRRHVRILEPAAERVRHRLLDEHAQELRRV